MSEAIAFSVLGVGLVGPGLVSWDEAQAVLRGDAPYVPAASVVPPPQRLPAAERRRAGASVKVALCVADAACIAAQRDPAAMPSVFTSSSGDGANCHALCETLAKPPGPERMVSPTRFTNSVHNAPAGYWHIAVGSRYASTSVCAHDDSFGAGLLAALSQLPGLDVPVLLVSSETPYPEPLAATRPLPDATGVGLVLGAPRDPAARARLQARLLPSAQAGAATPCHDAALEDLRQRIPAGRALPLLEAIARRRAARVVLPASPQLSLEIALEFPGMTLEHDEIAGLIPHAGRMCLLDRVLAWDARTIRCTATSHVDVDHPLRSASGLLASSAIEYAAQAAALHGGLAAREAGRTAAPGYLASARGVRLHRLRLDDLAGELHVDTEHVAGDDRQLLYAFTVSHQGQPVAEGRLAVVLDTPLPP